MQIYYSLSASIILDENKFNQLKLVMKKAGVTHISVDGYFFGHYDSPIQKIVEAEKVLKANGFETSIISLPVGHPGNSLDPNDNRIILKIPSHWRYRIDRFGNEVKHCADIEPKMIKDNVDSIKELHKAGFNCFFMDDDIRVGNWGSEIQGCFCDDCIKKFNEKYNLNVTRSILSKEVDLKNKSKKKNTKLLKLWIKFNAEIMTSFISELNIPGTELGIMVMHHGDERHGIDITNIKKNVPNCLFRVGEEHFGDNSFGKVKGKTSELISILHHLNLAGNKNSYSETTIFPARNLSPLNWVYKAKMAMAAGVENLYLMGGSWIIEDDYWETLAEHMPDIMKINNVVKDYNPTFPIHVLKGDALEKIQVPHLPFTSGMPAKPIRLGDLNEQTPLDNKILIILERTTIRNNPNSVKIISKYRKIYVDKQVLNLNKEVFSQVSTSKLHILNNSSNPLYLIPKISYIKMQQELRNELDKGIKPETFPYISKGNNIILIWIKEKNTVIIFNLEEKSKNCILNFKNQDVKITLKPNEFYIYHF